MLETVQQIAETTAPAAARTDTAKSIAPRRPATIVQPRHLTAADSVYFGLSDGALSNDDHFELEVHIHQLQSIAQKQQPDTIYIYDNATATHTTLPAQELQHQPRAGAPLTADAQWISAIIIGVIVMLGVVKAISTDYIPRVMSLAYSDFNWNNIIDSMQLRDFWSSKILLASSQITFSIFLYELIISYNTTPYAIDNGPLLLLIIWGCVFAYHLFKITMHVIVGYAFDINNRTGAIIKRRYIEHSIRGIVILPIALIFPFMPLYCYPTLSYIGLALTVIMYLWRVLKSIRINLSDVVSLFYVVLYLCTVELIPIICITKFALILISKQ